MDTARFPLPQENLVAAELLNTKGLLSADKKHKKLAFSVLQAFYKELSR